LAVVPWKGDGAAHGFNHFYVPDNPADVATGIETDDESFAKLPDVLMHSVCPICGLKHSWWKREAKLADEVELRSAG
jgi:hypothetical protein